MPPDPEKTTKQTLPSMTEVQKDIEQIFARLPNPQRVEEAIRYLAAVVSGNKAWLEACTAAHAAKNRRRYADAVKQATEAAEKLGLKVVKP